MTHTLVASEFAPSDREERIREAIWQAVVRVEIAHSPDPAKIAARCTVSQLGDLTVCSVRSNATTIRRTPRLARDDQEPSLFLGLQISGSSMVIQDGREAVLSPGDLVLYDTTRPYTLVNDGGIDHCYFRVPRAALALPAHALDRIVATRLGRDHAVTDLASAYFARLGRNTSAEAPTSASSHVVAGPSIELIRAVIATQLDDEQLVVEPLQSTLELRIMEYLRAHLAENDLTAAQIAVAHHISVRQLYTILARSGIGLSEWVRANRLEQCRRELARPAAASTTIAAVARRWGFVDAAHFSRVFREAFGCSPREWRQQNVRTRPPRH